MKIIAVIALLMLASFGCSDDPSDPGGPPSIVPAAVSGVVWLDVNNNGIREASETTGVPAITVALKNAGGADIASTQSGSDGGGYVFEGLAAGSYSIEFVMATNHFYSPQDQGADDTVDSDANPANGLTAAFTLTDTEINDTVDCGLLKNGTIRGRIWLDSDMDGAQDPTETSGVSGVTVDLMDAAGTTLLDSRVTPSDGQYNFANLAPAQYRIRVTAPGSMTISPMDAAPNDQIDSDVSPTTGLSDLIPLIAEGNAVIDAGLHN